jgi:hypothetical protein
MSDSTKSEFTCSSNSFARALVIGPILISLDLSCAATSLVENDGKGLGMSSSANNSDAEEGDAGNREEDVQATPVRNSTPD